MDVSGPKCNERSGTLTPLSRFCCRFCLSDDQGRRCGQEQARLDGERKTPARLAVVAREGRSILPTSEAAEIYQLEAITVLIGTNWAFT
jgi:hypothetical protein